jgi:hypothetical protein
MIKRIMMRAITKKNKQQIKTYGGNGTFLNHQLLSNRIGNTV